MTQQCTRFKKVSLCNTTRYCADGHTCAAFSRRVDVFDVSADVRAMRYCRKDTSVRYGNVCVERKKTRNVCVRWLNEALQFYFEELKMVRIFLGIGFSSKEWGTPLRSLPSLLTFNVEE